MSNQTQIKILGSGCASCQTTYQLIESVLAEQHIDAALEKIEDLQSIMSYGVMSTPAIVVNGVVVHAGSVPKRDAIKGWLAAPESCCAQGSAENTAGCCDSNTDSCCDSDTAKNDSGCCSSDKSPCC